MLMVGAVVLSNGAEMLFLVGNVLVFMHNMGHVVLEESIIKCVRKYISAYVSSK